MLAGGKRTSSLPPGCCLTIQTAGIINSPSQQAHFTRPCRSVLLSVSLGLLLPCPRTHTHTHTHTSTQKHKQTPVKYLTTLVSLHCLCHHLLYCISLSVSPCLFSRFICCLCCLSLLPFLLFICSAISTERSSAPGQTAPATSHPDHFTFSCFLSTLTSS